MRPNRLVTALALSSGLLLSLPAPAFAQDYSRPGFYAGVGVLGGSYTAVDSELEDALRYLGYLVDVDTDATVGFELYGGYRFHPNLALEAEFELLPETDIDVSGVGKIADLESWTLTANGKFFPLTGPVQPFVLLGLGVMDAEVNVGPFSDEATGFATRFGGGVDLYATENIVFSAGVDYVLPTGDVEDLDYVSYGGGFQYRF